MGQVRRPTRDTVMLKAAQLSGGRKRAAALVAALALGTGVGVDAEVVHDASFGHAGALAGPNFQIGANRGQILGPNLFHSFSKFNLSAQETATFSGPTTINN